MMQYPKPDDLQQQGSDYPFSPMLGLGLMLWVLLVYLFLRNAGHVLGLLATGAGSEGLKLMLINTQTLIKDPSVFNGLQISIRSLGGMLLPVIAWAGFMFFGPKRGTSAVESLKLIFTAGVLPSLVGWVLLPLAYKAGQTTATEDITLFLVASGWSGILTGFLFALLFVGCFILARRRISYLGSLRDLLQGKASDLDYAGNRGFYLGISGTVALIAVISLVVRLIP